MRAESKIGSMLNRLHWCALPLMSGMLTAPILAQAGAAAPTAVSLSLASLQEHRVVPAPSVVTGAAAAPFVFGPSTTIIADGPAEVARSAEFLARILRKSTGFALPVSRARGASNATRGSGRQARSATTPAAVAAAPPGNVVVLRVDTGSVVGDEAYAIDITADTLRIVASKPAGVFYGVATVRQLLPFGIEAEQSALRLATTIAVPAGSITDRPRFAWRGSMLDVARGGLECAVIAELGGFSHAHCRACPALAIAGHQLLCVAAGRVDEMTAALAGPLSQVTCAKSIDQCIVVRHAYR
jgi:hexosaminidase